MPKRSRIRGHYVKRRADGTFKKWTSVGKSIARDRRKVSDNKPKSKGKGHKGDYYPDVFARSIAKSKKIKLK